MEKESMTPEKNITKTPIKLLNKIVPHMSNDSPAFKLIGSHSTPPSRFFKVRNPFDAALANRLHLPISSPSVFEKLPTPKDKFRWTIEEISNLNPAPIEEQECNQFDQPEDPEIEETAHKNIEKAKEAEFWNYFEEIFQDEQKFLEYLNMSYFSEEKQIVPSPWDESKSHVVLLPKDVSTPFRSCSLKSDKMPVETRDGICQTVLSLPSILPPEIESVLLPYFTFTADQQQSNSENSMNQSLCRRLFHDEPVESETSNSTIASDALPPFHSPDLDKIKETANCDNDFNRRHLMDSPPESPVLKGTPTSLKNCSSKIASIHQSTPTPSPKSTKDEPSETLEESPLSPISKNIDLTKPPVSAVDLQCAEDMKMDDTSINITPVNSSRRSIKRLEFSDEMCVDYVPDSENLPDQSMNLMSTMGTSLLAAEEDCTYSSVNWDIENRSISNMNQSKIIKDTDIKADNLITLYVPPKNLIHENTSLMDISNCIASPPRRRQRLHSFVKKYSEDFDDRDKENIPYHQHRRTLRRCFSDVSFGSTATNMCNNRGRRNYYPLKRESSSTAVSSTADDDDDSVIRDRSWLDSDRDNNSPFHFETEQIVFNNENTQDTGYNSNTGEVSVTTMFGNTHLTQRERTPLSDKELALEFTSTPKRANKLN